MAITVEFYLHFTLMTGSLSRVFGVDVGQGSETAKSRTIFRRLVRASPGIEITGSEIVVSLGRSAKSALLLADGFAGLRQPLPWLDRQSRPQTALLLSNSKFSLLWGFSRYGCRNEGPVSGDLTFWRRSQSIKCELRFRP